MKITVVFIFVSLFSILSFAVEDLPNLRKVNENFLRSGRPTEAGLTYLVENEGLRTIINLEDAGSAIKKEKAWAEKLGIAYFSFPTKSFSRPKDEAINEILQMLNDPANYPILVHCKHGEDRTGMVTGLYRVFTDKWTPEAAYEEMLDLGFHQILFNLDKYFKEKSGYQNLWNFPDFGYLPNTSTRFAKKNRLASSCTFA